MTPSISASNAHPSKYRADIDGLRALAVLPVILFHAGLGCSGGFVGVDIFFVISGFLISSLIMKELNDGTFSLISFWERRIRRILPVLTVVVIATILAGWFLCLPRDFKHIGKSTIGQATLISNIIFWRDTNYFGQGSDTKPLLHTWSLAVEEQFYRETCHMSKKSNTTNLKASRRRFFYLKLNSIGCMMMCFTKFAFE